MLALEKRSTDIKKFVSVKWQAGNKAKCTIQVTWLLVSDSTPCLKSCNC